MILYLDTSALVPLLVVEVSTGVCGELWDAADRVVTVRLAHVEAAAALAMAQRLGRVDAEQHDAAIMRLSELWPELDVVEIDETLMRAASDAARAHGLRGCDAVHHAAALVRPGRPALGCYR